MVSIFSSHKFPLFSIFLITKEIKAQYKKKFKVRVFGHGGHFVWLVDRLVTRSQAGGGGGRSCDRLLKQLLIILYT